MVITKALAEKYLIRQSCWMITTDAEGNYGITYTSVHWKEGMEVFLTEEECFAELDRLQAQKMNEGSCPRCNLKSLTETDRDITKLGPAEKIKSGTAYRCASCGTLWYTLPHLPNALAYDTELADYVTEWGTRNLKPTSLKTTLNEIKDISDNKHFQLFPSHVILKNGDEFPCAMILLENRPPPPDWFNKKKWFYLDQVKEVKSSEYAYPYGIAKQIQTRSGWVYLRDEASHQVYAFDSHAGVFMPTELVGKNLQSINSNSVKDHSKVKTIFEPADRGGPDHWTMTQPPNTVWVWGDLE